ncbi:MAG: cytochrome c biogenesis protein CcsA [Coriobacteriia bacterium]|nr:cytochrome c biogenesis protein CcsA [Coriobacteriia bacterium]MBN2822480.1 cytochrome c biogenesis protein CcsA [Coriobacteriia bacterium]
MEQFSIVAFWFATVLYTAATVLYGYWFLSKRRAYSWYATFLTGAGFLCHTLSIYARSRSTQGTLLDGSNTLILLAWALVLLYFIMEHLIKIKVYGTALVPASVVMMTVSQVLQATGKGVVVASPLVENWKVGIHVALITFSNAGYLIGAVAALAYVLQERQLKSHKTNVLFRRLPPLGAIDTLARRAIAFAFPAYTGGLLLGVVRAIETDPPGWWADPRVVLAGLVWLIFGTYLFMRYRGSSSAKTTATIALVGAVVVVILAVVARTVPAGFHIFGI